jgi:hypothetical protein
VVNLEQREPVSLETEGSTISQPIPNEVSLAKQATLATSFNLNGFDNPEEAREVYEKYILALRRNGEEAVRTEASRQRALKATEDATKNLEDNISVGNVERSKELLGDIRESSPDQYPAALEVDSAAEVIDQGMLDDEGLAQRLGDGWKASDLQATRLAKAQILLNAIEAQGIKVEEQGAPTRAFNFLARMLVPGHMIVTANKLSGDIVDAKTTAGLLSAWEEFIVKATPDELKQAIDEVLSNPSGLVGSNPGRKLEFIEQLATLAGRDPEARKETVALGVAVDVVDVSVLGSILGLGKLIGKGGRLLTQTGARNKGLEVSTETLDKSYGIHETAS